MDKISKFLIITDTENMEEIKIEFREKDNYKYDSASSKIPVSRHNLNLIKEKTTSSIIKRKGKYSKVTYCCPDHTKITYHHIDFLLMIYHLSKQKSKWIKSDFYHEDSGIYTVAFKFTLKELAALDNKQTCGSLYKKYRQILSDFINIHINYKVITDNSTIIEGQSPFLAWENLNGNLFKVIMNRHESLTIQGTSNKQYKKHVFGYTWIDYSEYSKLNSGNARLIYFILRQKIYKNHISEIDYEQLTSFIHQDEPNINAVTERQRKSRLWRNIKEINKKTDLEVFIKNTNSTYSF